jgi:hypothetical protein
VKRETVQRGDYRGLEDQLYVTEAYMLQPNQRNLVNWMIHNPEVKGIGRVKAHKLERRFGGTLTELLAASDTATLTEVLTTKTAINSSPGFGELRTMVHYIIRDYSLYRLGSATAYP